MKCGYSTDRRRLLRPDICDTKFLKIKCEHNAASCYRLGVLLKNQCAASPKYLTYLASRLQSVSFVWQLNTICRYKRPKQSSRIWLKRELLLIVMSKRKLMRNADLHQLSAGTLIVLYYTKRAARITYALTRLPKNNTFAPIPSGRAS